MALSSETKIWLVTGCSSGFGLCIAEHALRMGDKVVATLRKPEVLANLAERYPDTLLVIKLDVTNPAEVTAVFAAGRDRFGRIDVVVNNAGVSVIGEMEGTPDDHARNMFEVNFWGASHVSKEAVRFFREENKPMGGRLLQVSSGSGIRSAPGFAYYCASKFALEALSEGLATELVPDWNIKVTILEPGPFRTRVISENLLTEPIHPAYSIPFSPTMQKRDLFANPFAAYNGDPEKFANVVYRVAYLDEPPLRLPVHAVSLDIMRERGKHLLETVDKWESWSEDVMINELAYRSQL